ncbi:DUF2786 domain-containing protein [Marinomonas sp. IMCC 4694]|uniref:DUF2786 domain-containing protein n=1 Tax=Marinomonas sp. IMCC 4694 TaxID=2605432 RepID=UPI0011E89685|nr:DUF2786 domain-containing protein [Marinomonas sp. IMCC 4694]TYL47934.1 DUF2786 domain-containing protein [Marinomonas sp. IMCC 4694]
MSITKRKKAIQKIVKLLNLATSTNSSESVVALRHAESLIRQYQVAQKELPILQLCDRSMLYRVSWSGVPKYVKEETAKPTVGDSVYQRRFSEKSQDPSRAYESAKTILDDMDASAFEASDATTDPADALSSTQAQDARCDADNEPDVLHTDSPLSDNKEEIQTAYTSNDNVINAAKAFRPHHQGFAEALKTHYAASDPCVPFAENGYWAKIEASLAGFDEAKVHEQIECLDKQLLLAQENLQSKKQKRHHQEQEEVQERAERARIEQSFEEAIERAFQARAKSHEIWENSCAKIRMVRLRDEQEAVQGYDEISRLLLENKESYRQHLKRKEDYSAAKIMHELRRHLALAVSVGEDALFSYDEVINIMQGNGLSLKDLEFSDIKNKSLFIRLLERESALIEDVQQREIFTEEMLDKFLTSNFSKHNTRSSETPIQHVQRLLVAASEGGQFETQKSLDQAIYLMDKNGIGVRDIGYRFIKKYSVFIRLINWEAERIASLPAREKFTASILEEYIQQSVQTAGSEREQKVNR